MWQCIETKATSIEQFRKGDNLSRTIEDIAGEAANAAEMKAAATGNELIFTQVKLRSDLRKLEGVYQNFVRSQHHLESRISRLEQAPEQARQGIDRLRKEIELRDKNTTKEPFFAAQGRIYDSKHRDRLMDVVTAAIKKSVQSRERQSIGQYRGFEVQVTPSNEGCQFGVKGSAGYYQPENLRYLKGTKFDINGFLHRMDNFLNKFEQGIGQIEDAADRQAKELETAKASRGQVFPEMAKLEALREDNSQVIAELRLTQKDPSYKSTWQPKSWNLDNDLSPKADSKKDRLNQDRGDRDRAGVQR